MGKKTTTLGNREEGGLSWVEPVTSKAFRGLRGRSKNTLNETQEKMEKWVANGGVSSRGGGPQQANGQGRAQEVETLLWFSEGGGKYVRSGSRGLTGKNGNKKGFKAPEVATTPSQKLGDAKMYRDKGLAGEG